jgi:hypothetical protein
MFVMQATRHGSGARREGLADSMAGLWRRGRHDEAGRVDK